MSHRPRRGLPWYARPLFKLFGRRDGEFIIGDIEERYRRDANPRKGRVARHLGLVADVIRSLGAWYRPRAVWRRVRAGGPADRVSRGGALRGIIPDGRLVLRSLGRSPVFLVTVVLTLGLGIGATTTIYGVVDAVIVRPLPYPESEQLLAVGNTFPGREWADGTGDLQHLAGVSYLNFIVWKERAQSIQGLTAVERSSWLLPDRGNGPELAAVAMVTPGFFDALRVAPARGRTFHADDHAGRSGRVAILGHETWVQRFGSDPEVVGQPVASLGSVYTVVGILPAGFRPPETMGSTEIEFWIPLDPTHPRYEARGRRSLTVFGRRRPDTDLMVVRSELDAIQASLALEHPDGNVYPNGDRLGAGANALHAQTVGSTRRVLLVFLFASTVLLFVAGLNAANLMLVRGADRIPELGLRQALGAPRARLVRAQLLESLVVSAMGGVVGAAIAVGGVEAFRTLAPATMPRLAEVVVNLRVLVACAAIALGLGVVVGLLPALRLTGQDLAVSLRRHAEATTRGRGERFRGGLVAGQLALAAVVAVGAGLLMHSFIRVTTVDPGFRPENVTAFSLGLKRPGAGDEAVWQAWDGLLDHVRGVPGLSGVEAASNVPFQSPNWAPWVLLPGEPSDRVRTGVAGYVVTPGYFDVIGTPVADGRGFLPSDGPDAEPVAIVNRAFVREHLAEASPLGLSLRFRQGESLETRRVVGLVDDVVQTRAEEGKLPAVYLPYTQTDWPIAQVVVRSDRDLESLAPELRQAAARFSPYVPIQNLSTMRQRMGSVTTEPRFRALLLGGFAGVTVLLAAIGLYGVLAHAVGRRTRELGVRMALGADRRGIFRLVMGRAAVLTGVGLGLGLLGAAVLTRYLQGFLFGIGSFDLPSFGAASGVLLGVAAVAALGPAVRATGVDVVRSLRSD